MEIGNGHATALCPSLFRAFHTSNPYFLSNFLPACRSTLARQSLFQWKISPGIAITRSIRGKRGVRGERELMRRTSEEEKTEEK